MTNVLYNGSVGLKRGVPLSPDLRPGVIDILSRWDSEAGTLLSGESLIFR